MSAGKAWSSSRSLWLALLFLLLAAASWAQPIWFPDHPLPAWVPLTLSLLQPVAFAGLRLVTTQPVRRRTTRAGDTSG